MLKPLRQMPGTKMIELLAIAAVTMNRSVIDFARHLSYSFHILYFSGPAHVHYSKHIDIIKPQG